MLDQDDYYCKIFIDASITKDELTNEIENLLETKSEVYIIESENAEICINTNKEFSKAKDDFLFYPFYLDIIPKENTTLENYIKELKKIISHIIFLNYKAIPACDFEEELI